MDSEGDKHLAGPWHALEFKDAWILLFDTQTPSQFTNLSLASEKA